MNENYCFTCGKYLILIGAYCEVCNDDWNAGAAARHNSTDLGIRRK